MKNKIAYLGAALVIGFSSCSKTTDAPGSNNQWTVDGTKHIAKSVTAYTAKRKLTATDEHSTLTVRFFKELPTASDSFKIVNDSPAAANQISIEAVMNKSLTYVSYGNDTGLKVAVTIYKDQIRINLPSLKVVNKQMKDSMLVSCTLRETMRSN